MTRGTHWKQGADVQMARDMLRMTEGRLYPVQVTRWLKDRREIRPAFEQLKKQKVRVGIADNGRGRFSVWRELLPGDTIDLLQKKYPDLFVEQC